MEERLNKIVELIDEYLKEDLSIKERSKKVKELINKCSGLLAVLESCDEIDSDFAKRVNENKNKYEKEQDELSNQIFKNYYTCQSARRVKNAILKCYLIKEDQHTFSNVKYIIGYYQKKGVITSKEEILLCNELEYYNSNRKSIFNGETELCDEYRKLPNMLNGGFEQLDDIKVASNRKSKLNGMINKIVSISDSMNDEEIISVLEQYRSFDLEENEFEYIINGVIRKYLYEMLDIYEFLLDKEFYSKFRDKKSLVYSYYSTMNKYLNILRYYKSLSIPEELQTELTEESIINQVVFARSNSNKAKMIRDLDDIPKEYYEEIYDLFNRFQINDLSKAEYKMLSSNKKVRGYSEVKNDQIRIVLKHMKDNIYAVMGVFLKKDDNDPKTYEKMCERTLPNISTEELLQEELEFAKESVTELGQIVDDKGRKFTR